MRRILFITFFLFCQGTMGAQSESEKGTKTNPYQLSDSVVVTANRFGAEKRLIPWPVAMIDPSQATEGATIGEKLDGVAGVDIRQYNGVGSVSTLSSWGMLNRNMLLLYDGRVVRDLYLGGFNLSEFSAEEFERIELVKGPQSAFFGSNAVGGVLNLIPRNSFKKRIKLTSRYGTDRQRMMRVDIARSLQPDRLGVGAYAELGAANNNRDNSGSDRQLFGTRLDYLSPEGKHKFSLTGRYFQDSLGVPGPLPDKNQIPFFGSETASTLNDLQQDENLSLDLNWTYLADNSSAVAANLFWERKQLHYFSKYQSTWPEPGEVKSNSRYDERLLGFSARFQKPINDFSLAMGVDFLSGSIDVTKVDTTDTESAQTVQNSQWDSPQDQWEFWSAGTWQAMSTIRFDLSGRVQMIRERKTQPSYNMGLVFVPDNRWSMKFGYGYAFRLPTLDEQFAKDAWYTGNDKLNPETSRSVVFTVGFADDSHGVDISASLFLQRVDSMIRFYTDPDTWQTTYVNISKLRSKGVDIDISYRPAKDYMCSLNLVYQKPEQTARDGSGLVPADYVPQVKWRCNVNGRLLTERLVWQMNLVYTSDRGIILYDGSPKRILRVYELGAGVNVTLTDRVKLRFSGSDLTDQARPDQFGFVSGDGDYPSSGRRFLVEVSVELN